MKKERSKFPVKIMARALQVSRSGFYRWISRKPSVRAINDEFMRPVIRAAFENSRQTYGPRRLQSELAANGIIIGRDHISRISNEMNLRCVQVKKFKATTNSQHSLPVAPNLLEQKFTEAAPSKVWGTDITYIPTDEGWLYLAGVKDFGTKEIVGYAMGSRMNKDLVHSALDKAVRYRKPENGCIHHSDRGSQYCALTYQESVKNYGMIPSMSRKGNCYDNAPTESFWGSLKQELVHHEHFKTRDEATALIQEYIEIFYNRIRRHSAIGNMAPAKYAEAWFSEKRKAA
jgi:transposase InsO family protein